jgi:fermentation-respiration switch protein FrsA (DUF1100 family)
VARIAGEQAPYISVDNARINDMAAGEGLPKELWVAPGGGHAESAKAQPEEYKRRVLAFLAQHF